MLEVVCSTESGEGCYRRQEKQEQRLELSMIPL